MNVIRKSAKDAAIGVHVTEDPGSLDIFLQRGCAAVVWQRQTPPHIQTWLDGIDPEILPRCREIIPRDTVADFVADLCNMSGLPVGPQRNWLQQDIVGLADHFLRLIPANFLRLRLDVVTTNACRKFHIDAITARLLCTYRGPGTQYGVSADGNDPATVFTVQTGAAILLRGTLWPERPSSRLLHRSPPIEGTGETRLVLVLDPVVDPEAEI
ncbi:MAG: DUF1826 domain-containing protein [Rhodobacteraceae bacterium]|nr:DUF1826 domain-containing protein [Paracoccaceae bacterium]MCY4196597.1 DUF1826 domain-containing protein [Paracoccaceae bacterium]MCY4326828.1 DUF1826 domain-containing protein [Paracoccaceae bacterium]